MYMYLLFIYSIYSNENIYRKYTYSVHVQYADCKVKIKNITSLFRYTFTSKDDYLYYINDNNNI